MTTQARVRRIDSGENHRYVDTNGELMPGVTSVLKASIPKPLLVNWAANTTAGYAIDHWDELGEVPPSLRLSRLRDCRWEVSNRAKVQGSDVHAAGEMLVHGTPIDVPEGIRPHVEEYARWLDRWDVQPVLVERSVYTLEPHWERRAGTLDLIADLADDFRWLLDIKTGKSVYNEVPLQLAAYRYAKHYIDDVGMELPMPPVDRCGVVHVRADGCDLIPVIAGQAEHRAFVYAAAVAKYIETADDLIGKAIKAPEWSVA